jgi:3-hydroxyisobutyrate dehydrogenase
MRVGFIGLGNVGGKLAGNLAASGVDLQVIDLDPAAVARLVAAGAIEAVSPRVMAEQCDVIITCLPSPAISAHVLESEDGVLAGLTPGTVWAEMSTTDAAEVVRLGAAVSARGASPVDRL